MCVYILVLLCCCLVTQLCQTLCDPMNCSMPDSSVLHYLPEFDQIHVHWVSDAIQPLNPLPPPSPFAFNLSWYQDLFQWVSSSHQVAKYWSFSFSSHSSNEYLGLIFFRIDWFDLFAIQGTLKTLVQHHNLKASVLQHSIFMDEHSHPYMTTGETIALTVQTFVGKVCLYFLICYLGLS